MPCIFASSRWLTLAAIAILAIGCKKNTPDPDAPTPAPPVAEAGPPATEKECKEFGEKLEKAVADGSNMEVKRLFRLNDLLERSVSDLGMSAKDKKDFLAGAAGAGDQFSSLIIEQVKSGGAYSVVRVRTVDGRPRVLMRLLAPEGAVNYHEFTLARFSDGQIATEDIYMAKRSARRSAVSCWDSWPSKTRGRSTSWGAPSSFSPSISAR